MRCPFCNAADTRVIDSRLADEGDKVRRRRECGECNERFTTYEVVELNLPRIVKSNGQRQAFNEDKLRAGMERALEKRPVSAHEIDAAISNIKREIMKTGDREIASRKLGELVVEALKSLDHVAYIRFASVYRSFEDADAFRSIIERLDKEITK